MEQLKEIYAQYENRLDKAVQKAGAFAGAFQMGDDPRRHPCNDMFYEAVEEWCDAFSAGNPGPDPAAEAVRWILFYPAEHRNGNSYWYSYAAQKHALSLIPMLLPEDAASMLREFDDRYAQVDRLPVQQEVAGALRNRAGLAPAKPRKKPASPQGTLILRVVVGGYLAYLGWDLLQAEDFKIRLFGILFLLIGGILAVVTVISLAKSGYFRLSPSEKEDSVSSSEDASE